MILNGVTICEKYISKRGARSGGSYTQVTKKKNKIKYPWFVEHEDTKQAIYFIP